MSRDSIARWLLDNLLASFIIAAIIVYGPMVGFNIQKSGMGTTYSIVASISLLISILANILIPKDFGITRRLNKLRGLASDSEED